ncbi:MAG: WYL domain-containing protein [Lachnospiraceae bacterium]|nr:WYL domain-containing protein [Lachnospiraceae bacterium]
MELFSEVYNCYFQVIKSLIEKKNYLSESELKYRIQESGFEESILYLLPKLTEPEWGFYEKRDGVYYAKLSADFYVPLNDLQRAYLKAMLLDEKIRLFLEDEEIAALYAAFADVEPLFMPEDFYYYDRFTDRDDYQDADYRKHFRMILSAIKNKEYLDILYEARPGQRVHHCYLPCRLEYSIKNDCFRLLAVEKRYVRNPRVEVLKLSRIKDMTAGGIQVSRLPDINRILQRSYDKEPVRIRIRDRRNALERAMLQFANYEKSTRKIGENTYECLIYYNKKTETELLIEILSFGPMLKVVGNEAFLRLVKERLARQAGLNYGSNHDETAKRFMPDSDCQPGS